MFTRFAAVMSIVAVGAMAAPARAQLEVDWRDADLGGSVDFVMRAPSGTDYVNILSLTEGPTCFGPKHPVGCIDVDLTMFHLSFELPFFFGTMPAGGEQIVSVSVPNDPALDGIVLNEQMVSLVGGKFTEKSNLCKIVFGSPNSWSHALPVMNGDRLNVPAIELPDGTILFAGASGANLDECELYEPCRQTITPTSSLAEGRVGHTVTQLSDGRVLVGGGSDVNQSVLATAEIYDPVAGTWSSVGSLATGRAWHSATLLPDGRILVAGGTTDVTDTLSAAHAALTSTELFDPATLAFTAGPRLTRNCVFHFAVALASGDVLVGGGATSFNFHGHNAVRVSNWAWVFQSATDTWFGPKTMKTARIGASSVLLADGRALVAGGSGGTIGAPVQLDTSETYDPTAETFTSQGNMSVARTGMTVLRLPTTDQVLVAGGGTGTDLMNLAPTDVAELFDPVSNLFTAVANLPEPRAAAGGIVLTNHHSILFGGVGTPTAPAIYRD